MHLLLPLLLSLSAVGGDHNHLVQPVELAPRSPGDDSDVSVFDCDFEEGESCLWTWEEDSLKESANVPDGCMDTFFGAILGV